MKELKNKLPKYDRLIENREYVKTRTVKATLEALNDTDMKEEYLAEEISENFCWNFSTGCFKRASDSYLKYYFQKNISKDSKEILDFIVKNYRKTVKNRPFSEIESKSTGKIKTIEWKGSLVGKLFVHEHIVSRGVFAKKLIELHKLNPFTLETLREFFEKYCVAAIITKNEDRKLEKGTSKDWLSNPWYRYEEAGLRSNIIDNEGY